MMRLEGGSVGWWTGAASVVLACAVVVAARKYIARGDRSGWGGWD